MEKRIHTRVRDLAPFASAEEDLSDERENSPPLNDEQQCIHVCPANGNPNNIVEKGNETKMLSQAKVAVSLASTTNTTSSMVPTVTSTTATTATVTPRIDISRASSSSYQEDSSPEREIILGNDRLRIRNFCIVCRWRARA